MGKDFCMSAINSLCHVIYALFGKRLGEKMVMAANVILHDWRIHVPFETNIPLHKEFLDTSDEEIIAAFSELGQESLDSALKYVSRHRDFLFTCRNTEVAFYNYNKIYPKADIQKSKELNARFKEEQKNFKYELDSEFGEVVSLVYHHGLILCPEKVIHYIRDHVFIDAGGCFGDSALIFLKYYNPGKVITFEPSSRNIQCCRMVMEQNHVEKSRYELAAFGLGRTCSTLFYDETFGSGNSLKNSQGGSSRVEIITLDRYCQDHGISDVRLIKADIEGMGLDMVMGAEEVIRANRPVLCLSIYHNREELFGIYDLLKQWELDYHFMIRKLS